MELLRLAFLAVLVAQHGLIAETEKTVMDLTSCNYPALYNFGDSISDTGGGVAAIFPPAAPRGETYFHRPAGRASDGRLIIDFIAPGTTIAKSIPGFSRNQFPAWRKLCNRRGNHSAVELIMVSDWLTPVPSGYSSRTFYTVPSTTVKIESDRNRLPKPEDFSIALYTFDIGQNDINVGFRTISMEELQATIPNIVDQFAKQIQDLYSKGARVFWIHNTGPIGFLPVATIKVQNPKPGYLDEHGCIKSQNHMAMEFNKKLKHSVLQLRVELSEAAITYVDTYKAKYDLISNAREQGFEDPFKICCGVHGVDIDVWCGNKATINGREVYAGSCAKPSAVISWDGVHYSEAANKWIASHIVNGSLSDPPIPITHTYQRKI